MDQQSEDGGGMRSRNDVFGAGSSVPTMAAAMVTS